ncbi:MAG: phosphodiesterase [Rubrivivax sp.]|jgi:Icc protein|nr:phosphodiesterase [Rubrivivax sp.]
MTLLVQLSDLHIKAGRRPAYGLVDTAAMLEACVEQVARQHPDADAVVITGDLVDHGTLQDYALLRELLAPLLARQARTPVYLLPGNHDEREALREAFPEHAHLRQGGRFVQYEVHVGPLRLLALDTVVPGEGGGALCEERLAWLATRLAQSTEPTVILMHHPPFDTGIGHMDLIGLQGAAEFEAVIAPHRQIERILCGHLHRAIQARVGGTLAGTCPSPAHQVALDLHPQAPDCFVMEPPGYQLHHWDGRRLVTHTAVVGEYAGPYRFREGGRLIDV